MQARSNVFSQSAKTIILMVDIGRHLIWLIWLWVSPVRGVASLRQAHRCHLVLNLYMKTGQNSSGDGTNNKLKNPNK